MTSVGLFTLRITLATVKVLPEPVTPSKVWCFVPDKIPSVSLAMAAGWSPAGSNGATSLKLDCTIRFKPLSNRRDDHCKLAPIAEGRKSFFKIRQYGHYGAFKKASDCRSRREEAHLLKTEKIRAFQRRLRQFLSQLY